MAAVTSFTGDPRLRQGPRPGGLANRPGQAVGRVRPGDAVGAVHDHVRAQGHRLPGQPLGPEPSRPEGLAAVPGRRHQAVLQGGARPDRGPTRSSTASRPFSSWCPPSSPFPSCPSGGNITVDGYTTRLQLADPPWGILVMLMASSITVYGVMLAGWSSGSKYPLIGAVRASAQMVSYEAALGLTVARPWSCSPARCTPAPSSPPSTAVPLPLEHLPGFRRPRRHLLHRHHGRDDPAALRPGRGRGGAGRAASTWSTPPSGSPCSTWPSTWRW